MAGPDEIREFELEVKLKDGSKQEYEYKRVNGELKAEVEMQDTQGHKTKQKPEDALQIARHLVSEVAPSTDMSHDELLARSRSVLQLDEDAVAYLEVEVEFTDGTEIEAKSRA